MSKRTPTVQSGMGNTCDHDHGDAHDHGGHGPSHEHSHAHEHPGHAHGHHGHVHAYPLGIALNSVYVVVELGAAYWLSSIALAADALHNLGDIAALIASWVGMRLARSAASARRTYGQRRWSILIALGNATLLLVAMGGIAWEAIGRLVDPPPIAGQWVSAVAAGGLIINGLTAALFLRATELNARAAFWHMAADAAVSAGVALAGLGVWLAGWTWLDPVATLVVVAVVMYSTGRLMLEGLALASDAVPPGIDSEQVRAWLLEQAQVQAIHDLHIWAISTTQTALTAHLVRNGDDADQFLSTISAQLKQRFGIDHSTIQLESGDPAHPCPLSPADAI